ncbi:PIN domain-containing protein [Brucella pseudogrignonensis]|uniref:PIN domain-containing protein n=1 Tax=Brucella pseudogrignonensis TaxID=419475 RepID=A0A7Y3WVG9_9HYPH|nr:PIN domain-containing protein [Brucella pseudogrignonensis]MCM0752680.1 PIN domain-containing protein [Brucella pseudogrignonensis]NNV19151.1 PIN domain-containing protein [Brucella pseudogrignonensis]
MASKPPVAVYDACVLYPFHLRNVLIQCAFDGLVAARWTDEIHAEWMRNLADNSPETKRSRLEVTRDRMKAVLPDASVTNYQALIPELSLPDPDDRHVLAAAIAGKASVIVTWNLKDFPAKALRPHGVSAVSPDDFLADLHAAFTSIFMISVSRARQNLRKTTPSKGEFVEAMERQGLTRLSSILRQNLKKLA